MRKLAAEQGDWHVTARGARRLFLFHDAADFRTFYAMLGESCLDAEVELIADCLLSNHFHLGLSGSGRSITRCMQRLNRSYSGYHNDRYDLSGHAFEQTYYRDDIPSDFLLKRVVRYIHLNPVRAGLSAAAEDYPWSSYRRLIFAQEESLGPSERRLLNLFGEGRRIAQESYRDFVEKDLLRRIAPLAGKTPAWEIWQEQFRWILEFAEDHQELLDPLSPESVAVHFGSRIGVPPRAMGRVLQHPNGRRVSEMIRALERRLERTPALRAKLEALNIL